MVAIGDIANIMTNPEQPKDVDALFMPSAREIFILLALLGLSPSKRDHMEMGQPEFMEVTQPMTPANSN